jgi:hypothetical protein
VTPSPVGSQAGARAIRERRNAIGSPGPAPLIYRLDEPQTGNIDCPLAWELKDAEPGFRGSS